MYWSTYWRLHNSATNSTSWEVTGCLWSQWGSGTFVHIKVDTPRLNYQVKETTGTSRLQVSSFKFPVPSVQCLLSAVNCQLSSANCQVSRVNSWSQQSAYPSPITNSTQRTTNLINEITITPVLQFFPEQTMTSCTENIGQSFKQGHHHQHFNSIHTKEFLSWLIIMITHFYF